MKILKSIFNVFTSYGMACILFLLLLVLVFVGTLAQVEHGLFYAQKYYFDSYYTIHYAFDTIPVPLPGVFLLLILLSINLIAGGIFRMRKDWRRAGVLIIHLGILFMLMGGLVKRVYATEGQMTLFPGDSAAQYESYTLWEIGVAPANQEGEVTEYIIDDPEFTDMNPDESRTFTNEAWPFDLEITEYMRNSQPLPSSGNPMRPAIDGFYLQPLQPEQQAETNVAGAYVTIIDKDTGEEQMGLVWGKSWWREIEPWAFEFDGETWAVELRKKRYDVPFTITLDKFERELHPGTQMAKRFSSFVTKQEPAMPEQNIHIQMNEPLRHEGITVYQSSWGPPNAPPGTPLYSGFSVVRNPSDQWPLYACIVISIGLVLHFSLKLTNYVRAEARRSSR